MNTLATETAISRGRKKLLATWDRNKKTAVHTAIPYDSPAIKLRKLAFAQVRPQESSEVRAAMQPAHSASHAISETCALATHPIITARGCVSNTRRRSSGHCGRCSSNLDEPRRKSNLDEMESSCGKRQ